MDGSIWKDLLNRLGCLDNGRFVAPKDMREVSIVLEAGTFDAPIMLQRNKPAPEAWSFTDDFIIYNDQRGHTTYYPWIGVISVNTNES